MRSYRNQISSLEKENNAEYIPVVHVPHSNWITKINLKRITLATKKMCFLVVDFDKHRQLLTKLSQFEKNTKPPPKSPQKKLFLEIFYKLNTKKNFQIHPYLTKRTNYKNFFFCKRLGFSGPSDDTQGPNISPILCL